MCFLSCCPFTLSPGSTVADVTYGKGVFWRKVPKDAYNVLATDLDTGVDSRNLPYEDESVDCVVFDPPYMHSPGGTAHVGHQNYEGYYKNNRITSEKKYHEAVLDLYFRSAREAWRVLRHGGTYIVKCQDQVCANQQRLNPRGTYQRIAIIRIYCRRPFCGNADGKARRQPHEIAGACTKEPLVFSRIHQAGGPQAMVGAQAPPTIDSGY